MLNMATEDADTENNSVVATEVAATGKYSNMATEFAATGIYSRTTIFLLSVKKPDSKR